MTDQPSQLLVIDNLDSFTYNLTQWLQADADLPVTVIPNTTNPSNLPKWDDVAGVVISPGPGRADNPDDLGLSQWVLENLPSHIPLLGVCLGMQAMAHLGGIPLIQAPQILHGKPSELALTQRNHWLWNGLQDPIMAMRYHSWGIAAGAIAAPYQLLAKSEDGLAMAMAHNENLWLGVQFHPESIGTPQGRQLLKNFLMICTPLSLV